MKVSYMTFVCPDWELEKVISFAREANYDGVELRVDSGHKHGISSASPPEDRERAKKLFDDYGIECCSIATSLGYANPDPEKQVEYRAGARANIDLAKDLGAPLMRVFAGHTAKVMSPEAADRCAALFDESGAYAEGTGVTPMLECGHDIIKGADEAAEVIKRVTTPNFACLWNTSTMDDHTFDALRDHLRHIHVHKEILPPENDNIRHLAKRLKTIDYRGYISLEIIEKKNLPEDLLKEVCARLKAQIAETYG